jgi:hypothetical protein
MALRGVQLGSQAAQVLGIFALLVALACRLLAGALFMIQAPAMKLAMSLCPPL